MQTRFRLEKCRPAGERETIGWFCSYTQEELIAAAGFAPVRLSSGERPTESAEAYLPASFCPYVRSLLGAALSGGAEGLRGVVFVASCDAMRRLVDIWTLYVGSRFSFRLDLPRRREHLAEEFLIRQLESLRSALGKEAGRPVGDDDIAEAIATANQTRGLVARFSALRSEGKVSGPEFFAIARGAMSADGQLFNAEAERFLAAVESEGREPASSGGGPRLLLCGGVADGPVMELLIEESGGDVVADDLCSASRHFDGLVDESLEPLRGLARRYLQRAPCARMAGAGERVRRLLELASGAEVDGVVYHSLKFCDLVQSDLPRVRAALEEVGIPLLHVDRDYSAAESGQLKTRVEAFVEMLGDGNRRSKR